MTDDHDRRMITHAHQRGTVTVRGITRPATLYGWHTATDTRGPNARVILAGGRTRTVAQADVSIQ